ncbi:hypothetical protein HYC85_021195 [Camellia sinensis]|uniref:Uncharacterized protein n=1 Tax=Camellia sinensis TaxID=4442 RepID=A0A7J7GKX3_CAMSI|nr:hypothetical protein HYC85_021195 [Camellia sinensis]
MQNCTRRQVARCKNTQSCDAASCLILAKANRSMLRKHEHLSLLFVKKQREFTSKKQHPNSLSSKP